MGDEMAKILRGSKAEKMRTLLGNAISFEARLEAALVMALASKT